MTEPAGPADRYLTLDSLRGICALAVALFHYPVISDVSADSFVRNAYLFVDFFFVLSGFVIAKAYEGRLAAPGAKTSFLIKRFGRVWPLHVVMLGLFVSVSVVKGELGADARHSVPAIFSNLALIHSLGIHKELSWNAPSWSISVEAFLYVAFMFLARVPGRVWVYGGLVLASMAVLLWFAPSGMESTYDYGVFRGIAGFFTGGIVARLRPRPLHSLGELAVVVAVVAFLMFGQAQILAPLIFGVAVLVFAEGSGAVSRLAKLPPFLKLGEWSYSIYMVHTAVAAVMWVVEKPLNLTHKRGASELIASDPLYANLLAIPYLLAVVGVSAVTYTVIEAPARAVFGQWAARARLRHSEPRAA